MQPLDALLYFYYGGMVYVGLKQYRKASDFFSLAISAPAQALSAVVIEAHRKYVLVSLLLEGQVAALPKYTSGFIQRQLKGINQNYLDFAKAYQTHKQDALKESYAKNLQDFTKVCCCLFFVCHGFPLISPPPFFVFQDKNAGLAAQVVESLYRRNILRLTQTYVTLSLADIATSAQLPGPKQAEEYLLRMVSAGHCPSPTFSYLSPHFFACFHFYQIEDGMIHAKIDQKEGMVSFQSNPEQYNTNQTMQKLDGHLKATSALGNRVDELQKKIALSSTYVVRVTQADKAAAPYDEAELDGPSDKHLAHGGVQLQ